MLDLAKTEDNILFNEMKEFIEKSTGGNTWIAVLNNGKKKYLHKAVNRPCYGELRSYGEGSTRPEDPKPGDLPKPLPVGVPREAVGVAFTSWDSKYDALARFMFSEDSPWRAGLPKDLSHLHFVEDKLQKCLKGVILTDSDFDATVFVSLIRNYKSFMGGFSLSFNTNLKGKDPKVLFLEIFKKMGVQSFEYSLSSLSSIEQFYKGVSRKLGRKDSWGEGDDYNRPALGLVFTPDDLPLNSVDNWGSPKVSAVNYPSFKDLLPDPVNQLKVLGITPNADH